MPVRDGLTATDYELVLDVSAHCGSADTVPEFSERLLESLAAAFGARYTTFFRGHSLRSAFDDHGAVVHGGGRTSLAHYHAHWRSVDVFASSPSLQHLNRSGVVSLHELADISHSFRDRVMAPRGLTGAAALRLPLPAGTVGVVGLFTVDQPRLGLRDRQVLQLLVRQLSLVSRLLPEAAPVDALAGLPRREAEVARLVGEGLGNADIALRLGLAVDTVKKYVSRALTATGCQSRTELAVLLHRSR
ncbi:LuxR C-terminal-related transcriptional regulator [Rhodococcus sp. X156]|uniref:helix-turn-helix transcriptional regulator n=1 Tax=Rhodococcus sp. X156 TaxID=2499145 RepID=UPI000FDCB0B8|nr:LuxR C-terminal-related transcriptional regulator [Rhodococcus sp. X156]